MDPDLAFKPDEPLTLDKMKTSLNLLQNGKCPSPDGF